MIHYKSKTNSSSIKDLILNTNFWNTILSSLLLLSSSFAIAAPTDDSQKTEWTANCNLIKNDVDPEGELPIKLANCQYSPPAAGHAPFELNLIIGSPKYNEGTNVAYYFFKTLTPGASIFIHAEYKYNVSSGEGSRDDWFVTKYGDSLQLTESDDVIHIEGLPAPM